MAPLGVWPAACVGLLTGALGGLLNGALVALARLPALVVTLGTMALFPAFLLVCYLILFFYFKSRGGYKAQVLTGHEAEDEKFTGGVPGPADL